MARGFFRLLHTADWHLGKTLLGVSRLEDQRQVLDQLHKHVAAERPDVVVIAGDIYDRAVPPAEAVALLNDTLRKLVVEQQTQVVLIAGNHDSPERLGFGADLLQSAGLHMRGPVDWQAKPVVLNSAGFAVAICPLPYAEPQPATEQDEGATTHEAALQRQIAGALAGLPGEMPKVAVAHAFVRGARVVGDGKDGDSHETSSEVERPLAIGGSGLVDAGLFAPFAYTALGHLHRPQQVGSQPVYYSGSLLQYSFAEAGQAKQVNCVDLYPDGRQEVRALPLQPARPLLRRKGTLQELIEEGKRLQQAKSKDAEAWLWAELTDKDELLDAMARLRAGWPNALGLSRQQQDAAGPGQLLGDHRQRQPIDVVDAFWRDRRNEDLSTPQRQLVVDLLGKLASARGAQEGL